MSAYATGEVVTVSGTAVALTAATYLHAVYAYIEVQANTIRWRADGTTPTSTVGFKAIDGTGIEVLRQPSQRAATPATMLILSCKVCLGHFRRWWVAGARLPVAVRA